LSIVRDRINERQRQILVAESKQEYSYSFFSQAAPQGETIVHAIESDRCAADDDHERCLLGLLGKHL
jgi:hypothetical protein